MTYDMEKYRVKREKVLGVRKRGINFGTMALIVSSVIVFGLGALVIPRAVAYLQSRNLDDAIYKMQKGSSLPADLIIGLVGVEGIKDVAVEADKGRVVVTFDRGVIDTDRIEAFFTKKDLRVILLNRVGHGHNLASLEKASRLGG
jgi:hypothetical protein